MLKLDQNLKYRQLPKHLQEHLTFVPTDVTKQVIAVFTFILLDLVIAMPLLFPFVKTVLFVTIPVITVINIWAILLLLKDSTQTKFESLLYLGFLGAVGSFSYFVLILKMNFYALNVQSPILISISIIVYLVYVILLIYLREKNTSLSRNILKSKFNNLNIIKWAAPTGYILTQIMVNQTPQIMNSYMVVMYSFIMFFFTNMGIKFLHRYLFMRNNPHLVTFSTFESGRKGTKVRFGKVNRDVKN
ncbi:hypothetical protein ACFQPF_13035 [Fictibacillus iocasae]|uniref:DUF418 domain-containing protein n=1 Tax=Fictibacillus iocasae TaxID=2715437 RepID=A0ABW2NQA9_9BACL